jgi:hypothetical protein
VSTGFQRIERTLNRILFLNEAAEVLDRIDVRFQLKRSYPAAQIGHFRAFVNITLRAVKHDILSILFGFSDKPHRFRADAKGAEKNEPAGIAHGTSHGAWEDHVYLAALGDADEKAASASAGAHEKKKREFVQVGSGSGIGMDPVPSIRADYWHDDRLIRFRPRLQLRDLENCMFMPLLNQSLAEKLHSIEVFANGYKLADIGPNDFSIDGSSFESPVPNAFTSDELADPWVRIRPAYLSSTFHLSFTWFTPRRMHGHGEIRDTPAPKAI